MRRDPRTHVALIVSALILLIVISTGEAAVMVSLGIMLALIMLVRRPAVDQRTDRADRELRARAEYEHRALMLGHDAVGIYGRFQPTPLEPVREELLPEHLRSTPDPAATAAPTEAASTGEPSAGAPPTEAGAPSTGAPLAETPAPPADRSDAHPTDPRDHDDGPRHKKLDSTSLHWVPRTPRPPRDTVVPDTALREPVVPNTAGPNTTTSRPIDRETPG